jgi:cytochrome P450
MIEQVRPADEPTAPDPGAVDFVDDPLGWLWAASHRGSLAVVDREPTAADPESAPGPVAVFGPEALRQVLNDIDSFGMPVSLARRHELPSILANLNSAVFSMTGARHRSRQQLLARLLGPACAAEHQAAIDRGLANFLHGHRAGRDIFLLHEMRRLARLVAEQVILGIDEPDGEAGLQIQRYFDQRRRYASRSAARTPVDRDALIKQGTLVDGLLREQIRAHRRRPSDRARGVLGHLCQHGEDPGLGFTEDELVAHANILFMASSEPIATAMTWIMLAGTQRPGLRALIRDEASSGKGSAPLLRGAVLEMLRLVPPSAIISRLTTKEVRVAEVNLPAATEVLLSPFVEHRRAETFPNPLRFWPERWATARPGPFQFLPFGNGARSCLGRQIALATLERATVKLLTAAEPLLPYPQRLDWRMSITLLPATDPVVRLEHPGQRPRRGHMLSGPAAALLQPEQTYLADV